MKNKIRNAALMLVAGASFASVGCNHTNIDDLFFTVKGKDLEVVFCDRGASIYSIKYKGTTVTYHPQDKNTFLNDKYYHGKALGRVAGRIKDGKFKVDNKEYDVGVNEKDSYYKNNNLHGGNEGISTKTFKRYVKESGHGTEVSFTYMSKAMESGFPEDVYCVYTYSISNDYPEITLNITGTPSGKTPLNLSNHPYFRLADEGTIEDHKLKLGDDVSYGCSLKSLAKFDMHDDKRTDQIVTGEISIDDKDITEWDFSTEKNIGKDIKSASEKDITSGGYDHIWKFDKYAYIKLTNPNNGISLTVDSDNADAVIIYANCYPNENVKMGAKGENDTKYAAITVEPIKFSTKDTMEDLMCTPTDPFYQSITYTFEG